MHKPAAGRQSQLPANSPFGLERPSVFWPGQTNRREQRLIFSKSKNGYNSPVDWAGRSFDQSEQPICSALFLPTLSIAILTPDEIVRPRAQLSSRESMLGIGIRTFQIL